MIRNAVILVHGHGAHPILMMPLRRSLEREGFRAEAWGYGSLRGSIASHAAKLLERIEAVAADPDIDQVHLVGHSMGAIVVRAAVSLRRPAKLGRIVLLAPPNRGAKRADFARRLLGNRILAANELSSDPESYVNRLPVTADLEIGVIAAQYDEVVAVAATHLPGQRDHLVLPSLHTVQLHRRTPEQVAHFLRHGKFLRADDLTADAACRSLK